MDKIKIKVLDFLKTEKAMILILNIGIMLLLNLMFYAHYDNEIDVIMESLLYGMSPYKIPFSKILFSNILLGKFILGLNTLLPNIAWYTLINCLAVFLSIYIISCMIYEKNKSKIGCFMMVSFDLIVGYECYIKPTYLKTATMLSVATIIVLVMFLENKKNKIEQYTMLMIMLAVGGCLFSFRIYVMTMVPTLILAGLYLNSKKILRKNIKKIFLILVGICATILLVQFFNVICYAVDGDWGQTYQISKDYEKLMSFGHIEYNKESVDDINKKYYETNGNKGSLIENQQQYDLFVTGRYLGRNTISHQYMHDIATMKYPLSIRTIEKFFSELFEQMINTFLFYYLLVFMGLYLIINRSFNKKYACIWGLIIFILEALIVFLLCGLEYEWIRSIIIIPVIVFMLLYVDELQIKQLRMLMIYFLMLLTILYGRFHFAIGQTSNLICDEFENNYNKMVNMAWVNEQNVNNDSRFWFADIVAYMKGFPAYTTFDAFQDQKKTYVINSIYTIFPESENMVFTEQLNFAKNGIWLFNNQNVNERILIYMK